MYKKVPPPVFPVNEKFETHVSFFKSKIKMDSCWFGPQLNHIVCVLILSNKYLLALEFCVDFKEFAIHVCIYSFVKLTKNEVSFITNFGV